MSMRQEFDPEAGSARSRLQVLLGLNDHVEHQIGLGETRATLLLASGGAMAAVSAVVIKEMDLWSGLSPSGQWLLRLAMLALLASIILALWAVRPAWIVTRLGARRLRASPAGTSVINFASVASQKDVDIFIADFHAKSDRDLEDDLLRALHGKSVKARNKFTELLFCCVITCSQHCFVWFVYTDVSFKGTPLKK